MTASSRKYVRYLAGGSISYGLVRGETIHQLDGAPFGSPRETGATLSLTQARVLAPCEPTKVIAVGLNYRSHLHGRPEPQQPGLFAKLPSSIVACDEPIVIPRDAETVHYEGELVVVIGHTAKNVNVDEARRYVFGVTAGNDVSERTWQRSDLQWLRAKGSDTFGPVGPAIVTGLDYGDLQIETRLNGELRQSERTADLIFSVPELVSHASRYFTLLPGDLIFTGTPGTTGALTPGDVVEVEVEGVGVLRNPVERAN